MTVFRRRRIDDFDAEIESHLALETDRLIARGLSPGDAARAARRAFGSPTRARERFHEGRPGYSIERLARPVRGDPAREADTMVAVDADVDAGASALSEPVSSSRSAVRACSTVHRLSGFFSSSPHRVGLSGPASRAN